MNLKVIFGILLLFISGACSAQITVEIYKSAKGTQVENINKIYISGAGAAFDWANVKLKGTGQKPLYWPPQELALNAENYIGILDREIAKDIVAGKNPVDMYLINGLMATFPCKR